MKLLDLQADMAVRVLLLLASVAVTCIAQDQADGSQTTLGENGGSLLTSTDVFVSATPLPGVPALGENGGSLLSTTDVFISATPLPGALLSPPNGHRTTPPPLAYTPKLLSPPRTTPPLLAYTPELVSPPNGRRTTPPPLAYTPELVSPPNGHRTTPPPLAYTPELVSPPNGHRPTPPPLAYTPELVSPPNGRRTTPPPLAYTPELVSPPNGHRTTPPPSAYTPELVSPPNGHRTTPPPSAYTPELLSPPRPTPSPSAHAPVPLSPPRPTPPPSGAPSTNSLSAGLIALLASVGLLTIMTIILLLTILLFFRLHNTMHIQSQQLQRNLSICSNVYSTPPAAIQLAPPAAIRLAPPAAIQLAPPAAIRLAPPAAIQLAPPAANVYSTPPAAIHLAPPVPLRVPICQSTLSEHSSIDFDTAEGGLPTPISSDGTFSFKEGETDSGYLSQEKPSVDNTETHSAGNRLKLKVHELYRNTIVASLVFMDPIGIIECDSSGGLYHNSTHDFTITIPSGAVPEGQTITIEIGITAHGPFDFPGGLRPISPVVWLHVQHNESFTFLKPVELVLPHYLDITSEQECQSLDLCSMKASCRSRRKGKYHFTKAAEQAVSLPPQSRYGTIRTQHFCLECIGALTPEDTAKVRYCLVSVEPEPMSLRGPSWPVYYCICFSLKTCIETVKQQYADQCGIVFGEIEFTFPGCKNPHLEIEFRRQLPEGWILLLKSFYSRISAEEVDFWVIIAERSQEKLKMLEDRKLYPPRFVIRVHGNEAVARAVGRIRFKGATKELVSELYLQPASAPQQLSMVQRGSSTMQTLGNSPDSPLLQHRYATSAVASSTVSQQPRPGILPQYYMPNYSSMLMPQDLQYRAAPAYPSYTHGPIPLALNHPGQSAVTTAPSLYQSGPVPVSLSVACHACGDPSSSFRSGQKRPASEMDYQDYPTDEDLEEVAREVRAKLGQDWPLLQAYLRVPDDLMETIRAEERTERGRVVRLLKEWRNMQGGTKTELANALQRADPRLRIAVQFLTQRR